jgi:hypothetical protein
MNIQKDNFLITNKMEYYKGNFIYLSFPICGHIDYFKIIKKEDMTIFKKMIEIANEKYKGYPTYTKLWISRRDLNIETYCHKRFCTNINEIADLIIKKGFHEIHFPIDFYHQIYLMNNVTTVFSEIGSSCCNIYFMKDNTNWVTNNDPNNELFTQVVKNICAISNIRYFVFDSCVVDIKSKYYIPSNGFNQPYKIDDVEKFKQWFIDWGF